MKIPDNRSGGMTTCRRHRNACITMDNKDTGRQNVGVYPLAVDRNQRLYLVNIVLKL
jgi:hypothetical protein